MSRRPQVPDAASRRIPLLALLMLATTLIASAARAELAIDGVWCEQSPDVARTAYVYLTMTLTGAETDDEEALVGAVSPVATRIDVLAPKEDDPHAGLMPVLSYPLVRHAPTIFEPHGPHLILRGLKRRLRPGESVPVGLRFAKAGLLGISAKVVRNTPIPKQPTMPKGLKLD